MNYAKEQLEAAKAALPCLQVMSEIAKELGVPSDPTAYDKIRKRIDELLAPKPRTVKVVIEVPEWAKWVAEDKNGHQWFYESEPEIVEDRQWAIPDNAKGGACRLIPAMDSPNPNWQSTLQTVEEFIASHQ